MKLTKETDYALRLLQCLARHDSLTGASALSEEADVPLRFTLKILRKLSQGGLVCSKPGAAGGYLLSEEPRNISLLKVFRLTEGALTVSRCLDIDYICEHGLNRGPECERCKFHVAFSRINAELEKMLDAVTLEQCL